MPKRTLQRNTRRRAKTHGFFARLGGPVLKRRRRKGRAKLTV